MRGRTMAATVMAGLAVALFAWDAVTGPGGETVTLWVDDLTTTGAGMIAAGALAVRAWYDRPTRLSWGLLAMAASGVVFGNVVMTYYELLCHIAAPVPSLVDAGYLFAPVLAGLGLLLQPARTHSVPLAARMLVDGLLVAGSLFSVCWVAYLGAVVRASTGSHLALAVSVAYPVAGIMLVTVTVLVMSHGDARNQPVLMLIAASLAVITVGQSLSIGPSEVDVASPSLLDVGYVAAFLLLAIAAHVGRLVGPGQERRSGSSSRLGVWLPYLICGAGLVASALSLLDRARLVPLGAAILLVSSLLIRMLLTQVDNRRLLADLAERKGQLQHQALHDGLTGLANRTLFTDRLDQALSVAASGQHRLAVLFLDLDDFKLVNDSFGHAAGDALLVGVAERLRASVQEPATIARLGGDEFAVLLEGALAPADVAARLADALAEPFFVQARTMAVRASIGLATADSDGPPVDADELLRRADVAMYSAKQCGKGRYVSFTRDLAHVPTDEFDLRDALTAAITEGTINVAYRPIVRTCDRHLLGFEALAQWSIDGTPVPSGIFLPAARRLGLIADLDQVVLAKALRQLAVWRRQPGRAELTCAIHVDESLFDSGQAVPIYAAALQQHGLPASALIVELPEQHLHDSPELARHVTRLRERGVAVALDGFGAQRSSLSHLRRIRVDTVRLDRTFLRRGPDTTLDEGWLGGVIDLVHRLGMRVIAEGVQTPAELRLLDMLGCDAVQGDLLGQPLPAERIRLESLAPFQPAA
jgi:diguanylate cyclase